MTADHRLSRRQLVLGAAGLGLAAAGCRSSTNDAAATSDLFTLGVAAGDPVPDGFVLWTRLARRPAEGGGMGDAPVGVEWQVATDERFRNVVASGRVDAVADDAHSVHVEVAGLQPGTPHWYRFRVGGEVSAVGRARTAPAVGASVDRLRLALASCQHFEQGLYVAHAALAAEDLDLVVFVGDYVYEGAPSKPGPAVVRQHRGGVAQDLASYRDRYAQYKADPNLQAAHAAAAWVLTPDDHEVANNYADLVGQGSAAAPPEAFAARRAAAYRAYWEHQPLRLAQRPEGSAIRLHRRLRFGDLATLHVLDSRQHRAAPAKTDAEAAAGARSVLGVEQEAWLAEGLAARSARWDLLANQVMVAPRRTAEAVDRGGRFDRWDGYPEARRRLLAALATAENPVVLTGDLHSTWASDLRLDPDDPTSPVVAAEVVGTSISSGGDQLANVFRAAFEPFAATNPQWKLFTVSRGYTVVDVHPDRLDIACRSVGSVQLAESPAETTARLVVAAGTPGIALAP